MGLISEALTHTAFFWMGVLYSTGTFGSIFDGFSQKKIFDGDTVTFLLKLAHLLCFSTAWGTSLWAFIGGFIAFMNLPWNHFESLQKKTAPAYLTLMGVCCAVSVAAFGYMHPWKTSTCAEKYQIGFILGALVFNLTNLFVFNPMSIKIRTLIIETESNFIAMNKKLVRIHRLYAVGNIISFGCLAMHLWYLAGKLNF